MFVVLSSFFVLLGGCEVGGGSLDGLGFEGLKGGG